jgi:hypothetical protein
VKLKPNVFVVAFILGAVVLTVLPLLQKRFLKAPEPIRTLQPWSLATSTGEVVSSAGLAGRVWLASFAAQPCDADCSTRQELFGRSLAHLADLDGGVVLVSIGSAAPSQPGWYALSGPGAERVLEDFRLGWLQWAATDAGSTPDEFAHLPGFALVDQAGALRGFWRDDAAGRGNAINAARLLWQHGARP